MPPLRFFRGLLAQDLTPPTIYYIRGTSSNVNGTETFNIQFIQDGALSPDAAEQITCNVDGNGNWEFSYQNKKIYSLQGFATNNTRLLSVDFSDAEGHEIVALSSHRGSGNFNGFLRFCSNLVSADLSGLSFKKLTMGNSAFDACSNLTTIVWSNELDLSKLEYAGGSSTYGMFQRCPLLTNASFTAFSNQTFASLKEASQMFNGCNALTSLDLSNATFDNVTLAVSMFASPITTLLLPKATFKNVTDAKGMFSGLTATSLSLPLATFEKVTDATSMFRNCSNLQTINWSNQLNFDKLVNVSNGNIYIGMFAGCTSLTEIDFTSQTFPALQDARFWFYNCNHLTTIKLPNATFAALQNANYVFLSCTSVVSIDMGSALCDKVTSSVQFFNGCSSLTTLNVPQNSTAILPTSTPANTPMYLGHSPLNYTSMLKVANWVSDLTGQSAHTCTFKSSAWNALSSAEQTTIDGILSAKNWTRALA